MKNIEKKFENLPIRKLSRRADFKIKFAIYKLSFIKKWQSFSFGILRPYRLALTIFLLFVTCLGVVPGYAYASNQITIGNVLYPVKKAIENVELKISSEKSETLLKFSLRRIKEAENVADKTAEKDNVKLLIEDALLLKNQAIATSNMAGENKIKEYNNKSLEALTGVARKVGLDSSDELLDAVAMTIESFSSVRKEVEKTEEIFEEPLEKNLDNDFQEEEEDNNLKIEEKPIVIKGYEKKAEQQQAEKKIDIRNLRKEVEELELELKDSDYKVQDVDLLIEKLNTRIGNAEKTSDEQESVRIIEPTRAIKNNAKFFVEKENSTNNKNNDSINSNLNCNPTQNSSLNSNINIDSNKSNKSNSKNKK